MMNFTWLQNNWIWDAVARRYYFLEPTTNRVRYEDGSYSPSNRQAGAAGASTGHTPLTTPITFRDDRYHQHSPDATATFAKSAVQDGNYIHDSDAGASLNASTPRYFSEAVLDPTRDQALAASPMQDHTPPSYSPTFRNGAFAQHSSGQLSPPAVSTIQTSDYTHHDRPSAAEQGPVDNATPRHFEQRPRGLAMPPLPEDRAADPIEHEAGQTPASDSSPADSIDIELDQAPQSETPPRSLKEEELVASGDILSNSPVPADASLSPARTGEYKRRDSHHAASQSLDKGKLLSTPCHASAFS